METYIFIFHFYDIFIVSFTVVSRAKIKLVEQGMTEEEAHEHIIREAMNSGLTKRQVAEDIID